MNAHHRLRFAVGWVFAAFTPITALYAQSDYATPYTFNTLAGTPGDEGSIDGTGASAQFDAPDALAVDSVGNVYVACAFGVIRKITPVGVVTTLAGTDRDRGTSNGPASAALFTMPEGIAVDSSGNVYVSDDGANTIRMITPAGVVTTLAGTAHVSGSTDGNGSSALFNNPQGLAVDATGNIYVADSGNNTIRKITSGGVVTTLAGTPGTVGSADGTGSAARFNTPSGVAVDSGGNIYVADTFNYEIRRISGTGMVTTLAGSPTPGSADGTGSAAQFGAVEGIALDTAGNAYVSDYDHNTIRKITPGGIVTTLAGAANTADATINGTGSAARFNGPYLLAVDSVGNIYVPDAGDYTIRWGAFTVSILSSSTTASGVYGQNFSYATAFSGALNNFVATGLPAGLGINFSTGVISGTIAANEGVYPVTLSTQNGAGSGDGTLSLTVAAPSGAAAYAGVPTGVTVVLGSGQATVSFTTPTYTGGTTIAGYTVTATPSSGSPITATGPTSPITVSGLSTNTVYSFTVAAVNAAGTGTASSSESPYIIPSFIVQPSSQTVNLGGSVTLSIQATGDPTPIYQWQFNGVNISGAATTTFTINNAELANAGNYTVVASNAAGSMTSNPAALNVVEMLPAFTLQPTSQAVAFGGTATFSANATGIPSPTYQWLSNGTNISGATSSSLTMTNAQLTNAGTYAVVATNVVGSVTSNLTTLMVIEGLPTITTEPASETINIGASASFSVSASGNPSPTYQWFLNGASISGATGSSLTINNAQLSNEGTYTVVVSNGAGSVTSSSATLIVSIPITYSTTPFAAVAGTGPNGVAVDSSGNVYVAVGNAVERVTSAGGVSLIAGSLTTSGSADGTGSAAQFNGPEGIATDNAGNIYVADTGNNSIRKVTPLGQVTTLAGLIQGNVDGVGVAAEFNGPRAVAVDASGNVYVADTGNNELRTIAGSGTTTTLLSGSGFTFANGPYSTSYSIRGVAVDGSGVPYIGVGITGALDAAGNPGLAVSVLKITGQGAFVQLFQNDFPNVPTRPSSGDGALAIDAEGNIYVLAENNLLLGTNVISTPSGSYTVEPQPLAIAVDADDRIYEAFYGQVFVVTPLGSAPNIATEPVGATIAFGASAALSVLASGTPTPSYQWQVNGVNIAGATSSSYVTSTPGTYTVKVTNTAGSVTSNPVVVTASTRLVNISTRAQVGTGANVEIAGFVISGPPGSTEQLLIRGVGPTLSQYGVTGVLAQPVLTLYNGSGAVLAANTGWGTNSNAAQIAATAVSLGAFSLPLDSADSALLVSLSPGAYTAEVSGLNSTTGVALAEAYEVTAGSPEVVNVSTRAFVSTGSSVEIAGIVVTGSQSANVLVRAVGPTLSLYGVSGVLAQPTLSVVNSAGTTVAINTGWSTNSNAATIASETAAVGAFSLPTGSADCALLLALAPGSYTAEVSGVGGTSGVCLVEAYQAP